MRALRAQDLLAVWESGQTQSPAERALTLLAAACPDAPISALLQLSIGQRDARLLTLRERCFGSQFASLAACPNCGEQLELNFDIADFKTSSGFEIAETIEPATDEVSLQEAEQCAMGVTHEEMDLEGYQVSFRAPNSEDLAAAASGDAGTDAAEITRRLLERCVTQASYQGQSVSVLQLPESVIANLTARMGDADPQADIQLALTCPCCGNGWQAAFDIVSFFWSEIGAWVNRITRDVHVLASAYGWRESDILAMSPWRRQAYLEMVSG